MTSDIFRRCPKNTLRHTMLYTRNPTQVEPAWNTRGKQPRWSSHLIGRRMLTDLINILTEPTTQACLLLNVAVKTGKLLNLFLPAVQNFHSIILIFFLRFQSFFRMLNGFLFADASTFNKSSSFLSSSRKFTNSSCCSFFRASSFSFSSFFAASCLHFVLLFWNQTLTCVSLNPNMAPICSLSRFVTYLVTWKRFSRPLRCSCVKTGRHHGREEVRMGEGNGWRATKLSSWLDGNWLWIAMWSERKNEEGRVSKTERQMLQSRQSNPRGSFSPQPTLRLRLKMVSKLHLCSFDSICKTMPFLKT